jgi:Transposase C of IS166 homeodomain
MQSLPEGIDALRALVLTMMSERDALALERDTLQTQNDRLRHLLLQLRRLHFGPRSERLPEEQLQLGLEALEQAIAKEDAETAHLPRIEVTLAPDVNGVNPGLFHRSHHTPGQRLATNSYR